MHILTNDISIFHNIIVCTNGYESFGGEKVDRVYFGDKCRGFEFKKKERQCGQMTKKKNFRREESFWFRRENFNRIGKGGKNKVNK